MDELDPVEFVPIRGYNRYVVTTDGRVFNSKTGREVKPHMHKNVLQVVLYKGATEGAVRNTYSVHVLVAQAFMVGYDPDLKIWRHDGDPHNCAIDNLYQRPIDRVVAQVGELEPLKMLRCIETDEYFYSVREAGRYLGIAYSTIYQQLAGNVDTAKGCRFEWVYNV